MKLYPSLAPHLGEWAEQQPVFFTGSAGIHSPHINVSPKGMGAHFAVLGPNQCAYIDRTGSGCETIAHSYENGRLCLMFMSFGEAPRIMRLFCRSKVVEWDQPSFSNLVRTISKGRRDAFDGARAVILCDIWEVQLSCGYAVPRVKKAIYRPDSEDAEKMAIGEILRQGTPPDAEDEQLSELAVFEERPTLDKSSGNQVKANTMVNYQNQNNNSSIDGLPGLRAARRGAGQTLWIGDAKARLVRIAAEREALATGFAAAVVMYFVFLGLGVL
jgi:hypothetical protein